MKFSQYFFFSLFLCLPSMAQHTQLELANKKYEKYYYIDAIKIYEKVAEKGYQSTELFEKLGNSYYFNSELEKSAYWYEKLFNLTKNPENKETFYRYAQCLKNLKKYNLALEYLKKYNSTNDFDKNTLAKLELYESATDTFKVKKTNINTSFYDFGGTYYKNGIVFTSSRPDKALIKKTHRWTNQNFTDLYYAEIISDSTLSEPENFSPVLNSKFNESSAVFTKDGKTVYFTRNNYLIGKKGSDKGSDNNNTTKIKIYRAEYINNEWTNIVELPFNSDEFSTAHPALSADEKTLYFTSDRPGTIGGADIFKVSIKNKNYGEPINLGEPINTPGRESFPFISQDGYLYFASDGHLGLGGLDVFKCNLLEKNLTITNLGAPINSLYDDFNLIIDINKKGFFTSNRKDGEGFDDIYSFEYCKNKLEGKIFDLETQDTLNNTTITLFNNEGKEIKKMTSVKNNFTINLLCDQEYIIRIEKKDYDTFETHINSNNIPLKLTAQLKKNIIPISPGTDLAKVFNISIIYFDLDKWNIRADAAKDIQKVIEVMKEYPNMQVKIRSHTDSRQTHQYNILLSERRAKSTLQHMVANGIEKERLSSEGLGETELVNECADNVPCSEEAHQLNRRSEFIIEKVE